MTRYRRTVDRLCGRDGTRADAEQIAAEMNAILVGSDIQIAVADTDDRIADEHREAVQQAWERAMEEGFD